MAGRARHHALIEELAKRTCATFEEEPEATSLDYVCYRIEGRTTTKALAFELQEAITYPVDDALLMRHLRSQYGAAADPAIDAARARASHSLVEEGLELVDAPAETMMDVSRAASRARQRNWMAERYNPSKYGQSKGVSVSVTVGSLHLDALKYVSTLVTGSVQPALPSPAHNTEVVGQVIAVDGVSVE